MRLPYTATIRDELLDIDIIPDLECEVDVNWSLDCGSIVFDVNGVYVEGRNLYSGTPYSQSVAAQIATEATDKLNADGNRLRYRALDGLEVRQ